MGVTIYEEKKLKYNKTELSEFSEDKKSDYEDEIKYLNEEQILKFLNGISNTFHQMVFSFLFENGARVSEALSDSLINKILIFEKSKD